ncbi:unnamed protein product [Mytilus edulis]|uniref:Reverse transcriptase domain-containing protein n=1 Tax=Mytilus edulis TaxID=6550 RepID=A0A8S3URY2_MYTED|nr:unnamed protein product [Mytilus edulis]
MDEYVGKHCPREITNEEVVKILKLSKAGKSPGCDEIPMEMYKNQTAINALTQVFNICYNTGMIPELWSRGIITPIPKSSTSDPRDPMSYRGITLAPTSYKLYCGVLNSRLTVKLDELNFIHDEQNGFRSNRSTIDHLSTITSIIETRKMCKLSTFAAFIDFKKAYDTVNRFLLFCKLESIGISSKMLNALKSLYHKVQSCVKVNGNLTQWFDVQCGLKQGCVLSPILFNIFINNLVNEVKSLNVGIPIEEEKICILLYADDIVLLAENESDLQMLLNVLHMWCHKNDISVNMSKSKIIHFRPPSFPRSIYTFMLEQVTEAGDIINSENVVHRQSSTPKSDEESANIPTLNELREKDKVGKRAKELTRQLLNQSSSSSDDSDSDSSNDNDEDKDKTQIEGNDLPYVIFKDKQKRTVLKQGLLRVKMMCHK